VFVEVYTLLPVVLEADVGVGKDTKVGNAKNDWVVFATFRTTIEIVARLELTLAAWAAE
jgi:hypothetical protein